MSKFRIEGDYYIIVDQYSYNLARYTGKRADEREDYEVFGYYPTIEKALNAYLDLSIRTRLAEAEKGELKDMVKIISSETKRLSAALAQAFAELTKWEKLDAVEKY